MDYNKALKADVSALVTTMQQVQVGDVVKATFFDEKYRTFEVTGVLQSSDLTEGLLVVGSWFLNTPGSSGVRLINDTRGIVATGLRALEVITTADRALF